jgi:hypothetical protein
MILVDPSVWVDHLRAGNEKLAALLDGGEVLGHAFVMQACARQFAASGRLFERLWGSASGGRRL